MSDHILSQRWPWGLAAFVAVAVYSASLVEFRSDRADSRPVGTVADVERLADADRPNVLFVLIDTLRASRMSVYGYENQTTPFLEQFASSGVLFERQLAQSSWTKSSMASLWTGMYPSRVGVTRFDHALSDEALMPAEILREAGYQTIGIYRNGWVSGYFGFEQGFDVYIRPNARPLPASLRRENPTVAQTGSDMDAVDTALEFLRLHGDDPWFLYLHLMDVHEYVYDQESARFGTTNSGIYDNAVLREDYVLETLIAGVDTMGYLADTLVVIASDHGEAFGERGFEGHAREVFPETTDTPLLLGFPFRLEGGIKVSQQTTNVDLWPTILELLNLPVPEDIDGISRVPEILAALRGEPAPTRDRRYFSFLDQTWGGSRPEPDPSVAVMDGDLRYVLGNGLGGRPVELLFDQSEDPLESRNLASERGEDLERLREIGRAHIDQVPPWEEGTPTLEIDEMDLNQLRALGYAIP